MWHSAKNKIPSNYSCALPQNCRYRKSSLPTVEKVISYQTQIYCRQRFGVSLDHALSHFSTTTRSFKNMPEKGRVKYMNKAEIIARPYEWIYATMDGYMQQFQDNIRRTINVCEAKYICKSTRQQCWQTSLVQNYILAIALFEVAERDPLFRSPYTWVLELSERDEFFLHITSKNKCTAGLAVTAGTAPQDLGCSILWFSNGIGSNLSLSILPRQRWCPFGQNAQIWPALLPLIWSSISIAYFYKTCSSFGCQSHRTLKVISCGSPGLSFPAVIHGRAYAAQKIAAHASLSQRQHQKQYSNILTAHCQTN